MSGAEFNRQTTYRSSRGTDVYSKNTFVACWAKIYIRTRTFLLLLRGPFSQLKKRRVPCALKARGSQSHNGALRINGVTPRTSYFGFKSPACFYVYHLHNLDAWLSCNFRMLDLFNSCCCHCKCRRCTSSRLNLFTNLHVATWVVWLLGEHQQILFTSLCILPLSLYLYSQTPLCCMHIYTYGVG